MNFVFNMITYAAKQNVGKIGQNLPQNAESNRDRLRIWATFGLAV